MSQQENARFLQGTPMSRQWLGKLIRRAVQQAEADPGRRMLCGFTSDSSQYVVGVLLAHTDLSEEEQTQLIAQILGQNCRI